MQPNPTSSQSINENNTSINPCPSITPSFLNHQTNITSPSLPRHSIRIRCPPQKLTNYAVKINMASTDSLSSSLGNSYPISHYLCLNSYSHSHLHFVNTITKHIEPTSFSVARKDPNWRKAMEEEIKALEADNTWT